MASSVTTSSVGDYDGDGCGDLLYQIDNGPKTIFFSPVCTSGKPNISVPDWLQDPKHAKVVLGDFNGDGKTDILIVKKDDYGTLWLSTGTALVAQSFTVPFGWAKYSIVTGDWNNDGKTDIALIAPGGDGNYGVGEDHRVLLSTGTGFALQFTIPNNNDNDKDQSESASVGDWNSDGVTDFWLQKPSGDVEELMSNVSGTPYVPETIVAIDNGVGARTTITYDRLNNPAIYTKGDTSAYPKQILNGPIYVVTRVDSSNGQGVCVPPTNCIATAPPIPIKAQQWICRAGGI